MFVLTIMNILACLCFAVMREELAAKDEMLKQIMRTNGAPYATSATPEADVGDACVICLTQPRSHILIPCGHKCLCTSCSELFAHTADTDFARSAASGVRERRSKRVGVRGQASPKLKCAAGLEQCPICRADVQAVQRIFE